MKIGAILLVLFVGLLIGGGIGYYFSHSENETPQVFIKDKLQSALQGQVKQVMNNNPQVSHKKNKK